MGEKKRRERAQFAQVGRLAFRLEGAYWNVYYAQPDTMKDAVFLGGIRFTLVEGHEEVKKEFMAVMRHALTAAGEDALGVKLEWPGAADESDLRNQ